MISVVVPALNADATLGAALAAVRDSPLVGEIVVADGGSRDATVATAQSLGARAIAAARGRGNQLAAGAAASGGEWLLFLHADCRLEPGWDKAARRFIEGPGAGERAGYFVFALDDPGAAARRLERLVAQRCRVLALPYGDQGLLISRRLYQAVGGFAPIPLMEDVDIVRRLGRRRLQPIAARAVSSARRYREGGYIRRPLRNLLCLSLYFTGMPPARLLRLYG